MSLRSLHAFSCMIFLATCLGCGSSTSASSANSPLLGGTFDGAQKRDQPKGTEEERFIDRQEKELKKQAQEIEDLKRQKFHDDYFRTRYPKETPEGSPSQGGLGGY